MIFKYSNYLDFLRTLFEEQSSKKGISLRNFATRLEIDHTVLSRVLKGERKLPIHLVDVIAKKLELAPIEKEYFSLLVEYEHVTTQKAKKFLFAEIQSLRTQRTLPQAEKEQFEVIADLTSFSILEMLDIKNAPRTSSEFAKALGVSEEKVQASLQNLLENKVIEINADGDYRKTDTNCSFKINNSNKVVENYFKSVLERAKLEVDTGLPNDRIYRNRIISIPKSMRPEICAMIDGFLGKLHLATTENKDERDELICLNVNFFSLFKQDDQKPEDRLASEL